MGTLTAKSKDITAADNTWYYLRCSILFLYWTISQICVGSAVYVATAPDLITFSASL